ncbi:MAG: DUF86 domain-containing protein [Acidobacteriota bacterium]
MSDRRDSRVYLDDILEAAAKAREFVSSCSFDEFRADERTVFAVIRAPEIVGEAAKTVPVDVRGARRRDPVAGHNRNARQTDPCVCRGRDPVRGLSASMKPNHREPE